MIGRLGPDGYVGQGGLAAPCHPAGKRAPHPQGKVQNDERIESGDVKDVSAFRIP